MNAVGTATGPSLRRTALDLRWARQIGAKRLLTTAAVLLVALLVARFSWDIPILVAAERYLYDVRTTLTAPRVEQDKRFALVTFEESTFATASRRSPLDRLLLARALKTLDGMGAKAIGVDILIDQPIKGEDDVLIRTLREMKTPTYFAIAGAADTSRFINPAQEKHLAWFFNQIAPRTRPASIRLLADPDGIVRRWPAPSAYAPPLANLLTGTSPRPGRPAVVFRQPQLRDQEVFQKTAVQLYLNPAAAPLLAPAIRDRIVLVGANLPVDDQLPTPAYALGEETTAGMEIHAHLAAQALDGAFPAAIPGWVLWLVAVSAVAAGAATSLQETGRWWFRGFFLLQIATLIVGPVLIARWSSVDSTNFPALGWVIGWLAAFIAIESAARSVTAEQRQFAQGALGKYLPKDVAQLILREPERLALSGEKREIFALFTDLEGFTKRSHALTPEQVATFVNAYLDRLCEVVLKHGGTIDKFVGDAIVAFWGAPIARPTDPERALAAARELSEPCELRIEPAGSENSMGKTRVGLHFGEVIVGNFGGSGRIQYTALGDAMNTAARMEAANKALRTTALVSREAMGRLADGGHGLRPMGRVILRGRPTPIEVYEPTDDEAMAGRLRELYNRFDGGDVSAIDEMKEVSDSVPDDIALEFFVFRLRQVGPGGSFTLE